MKKILLAIISMTVFTACSKNGTTPNGLPSIVGKWQPTMSIYLDKTNGYPANQDTMKYSPSSYSDFRTDGKIYSYYDSSYPAYDTISYVIKDSVLFFSGYTLTINGNRDSVISRTPYRDTGRIETLTDHNLSIYIKTYDSLSVSEEWDYFTR